jgi:valyl-tRNA synthetase
MVKDRFLDPDRHTDGDRASARWTLWEAYRTVLGLFAPFAPFVTEHMYQRFYAAHEGVVSVHVSPWPQPDPAWAGDRSAIEQMVTMLDAVRALRTRERLSANARIATLVLDAPADPARTLAADVAESLRAAARADQVVFGPAEHDSGVAGIALAVIV